MVFRRFWGSATEPLLPPVLVQQQEEQDGDESAKPVLAELVEELKAREPRYAAAFEDISALRVALDQELADFDAPLAGVREVAFFPPMTGG